MPNDKQEQPLKPPAKPVEGGVHRVRAAAAATSSADVRVRLIQQSPTANPKLVEEARKFAREVKEKQGDAEERIDYIPEAPLIVPVQE